MNYYQRMQRVEERRRDEQREKRRQAWVEEYSNFHDREWLESLSYAQFVCMVRSGELDRPTLI